MKKAATTATRAKASKTQAKQAPPRPSVRTALHRFVLDEVLGLHPSGSPYSDTRSLEEQSYNVLASLEVASRFLEAQAIRKKVTPDDINPCLNLLHTALAFLHAIDLPVVMMREEARRKTQQKPSRQRTMRNAARKAA